MNSLPLNLSEAKIFLSRHSQTHLFDLLSSLTEEEQAPLLSDLARLAHDAPRLTMNASSLETLSPFTHPLHESAQLEPLGKNALKEGKVLGILLAGGDGTRLGFEKPKGCFPISPFTKKSLFQLHSERVLAMQKQLGCSLPLALLTSPTNHEATFAYFKEHAFFGLDPSKIFFLIQQTLPLYTLDQKWFFKNPTELCRAPNGNGGLLGSLKMHSELLNTYQYFTIINIDNALAMPYDLPLISTHIHSEAEVTLRCFKHDPNHDKVGVLACEQDRLTIIDYTSLPDRSPFLYGNINTLCFSSSFLRRLIDNHLLRVHWIEKQGTHYDHATGTFKTIPVLKGEQFLSDTICLAHKAVALDSLAEDHFAPLKNLNGVNGVDSVQNALLHKDRKIFQALTGLKKKGEDIELSMEFHYPDQTLLQKCRTLKAWPAQNYLSPDML